MRINWSKIASEKHELQYRKARGRGDTAWGGPLSSDRARAWRSALDRLVAHPLFPRDPRVLDLGCGSGLVALDLAHRGYEACGIDFSPTAIAWARENAVDEDLIAHFWEGDVTHMPMFADGEFDVVIDSNCLHCVTGPEARAAALAEAHRVLTRRGLFYLSSNCAPVTAPGADYDPATGILHDGGKPYRSIAAPSAILSEVVAAGFLVAEYEIVPNPSWSHLRAICLKP